MAKVLVITLTASGFDHTSTELMLERVSERADHEWPENVPPGWVVSEWPARFPRDKVSDLNRKEVRVAACWPQRTHPDEVITEIRFGTTFRIYGEK